jgi:hypothetical protein
MLRCDQNPVRQQIIAAFRSKKPHETQEVIEQIQEAYRQICAADRETGGQNPFERKLGRPSSTA